MQAEVEGKSSTFKIDAKYFYIVIMFVWWIDYINIKKKEQPITFQAETPTF